MDVRGRRAWWCDACGRTVHWEDLRRQYREWCEPIASNYCLYSSYNSAFWTCDATDAGRISMGPYGRFYTQVSLSAPATYTETNGSQTWTGSGTLRSNVAVDASALTTFTFDAVIGPYHCPTVSPVWSATLGLCQSDGTVITADALYSDQTGMRHCWFTKTVAGLAAPSAVYVYMAVTVESGEKWFADRFRIEANVTSPTPHFLETKGAAINRTAPTTVSAMAAVCPRCQMKVYDRWNRFIPPPETIEPIPVDSDYRENS